MKQYIILGAVLLLFLVSLTQAFQINAMKNEITGDVVKEDSGRESYEEMMARMHPELAGQANQENPTMVGGC